MRLWHPSNDVRRPAVWLGAVERRVPSAGVRRTVERMSHRASDDEVRDQERAERDEVVRSVDPARLRAEVAKIKERDAELLKRLAR
mgnify:CR=1 FL=1